MPKMKTNKAAASRFKLTGTGKIKFNRPGRRHILTSKTPKRKRQLRRAGIMTTGQCNTYKQMIGA